MTGMQEGSAISTGAYRTTPMPVTASLDDSLGEAVAGLLQRAEQRAVTPQWQAQISQIGHRLQGPLRVAIAGKIKAGKSTLLNALVGEELAPTDAGECTKIVTWYAESDQPLVRVHPFEGPPERANYSRSGGALDIDLGNRTHDQIDHIEVNWPSSRLRSMTLIDTPGIASISADLSDRTLRVLTPDDRRPPVVDAVLYLLRHTHASDIRFLESFHDDDLGHGTPMNAVGVLSRADEIGACRLDALEVAARVAQRYQAEPRLHRLCPVIVPVAGLLGHTAVSLHEAEFRALRELAQAPQDELAELLLTADRLADRPSSVNLTELERSHLLQRLGLFGVRLCVELIRTGLAATSTQLAAELARRSGLEQLQSVLLRQFGDRSKILKARSALLALNAVLAETACHETDVLRMEAEQITAGAHAFEEVRLLDRLRTQGFNLNPERTAELDRLLGGSGHDPASRLGLDSGSAEEVTEVETAVLRSAAIDALGRWQSVAESPLTGRPVQLAARGASRTLEGLLTQLG